MSAESGVCDELQQVVLWILNVREADASMSPLVKAAWTTAKAPHRAARSRYVGHPLRLDRRVWPTALSALLDAGAANGWLVPIVMKEGRPAHTRCVLAPEAERGAGSGVHPDRHIRGAGENGARDRAGPRLATVVLPGGQVG
jgi:Protein of unknown function DUF111